MTRGTISALENGISQGTTHLLPISKALNVTPQWLESGKDPKRPTPNTSNEESLDDLAEKLLDRGPEFVGQLITLLLQKQAARR